MNALSITISETTRLQPARVHNLLQVPCRASGRATSEPSCPLSALVCPIVDEGAPWGRSRQRGRPAVLADLKQAQGPKQSTWAGGRDAKRDVGGPGFHKTPIRSDFITLRSYSQMERTQYFPEAGQEPTTEAADPHYKCRPHLCELACVLQFIYNPKPGLAILSLRLWDRHVLGAVKL